MGKRSGCSELVPLVSVAGVTGVSVCESFAGDGDAVAEVAGASESMSMELRMSSRAKDMARRRRSSGGRFSG